MGPSKAEVKRDVLRQVGVHVEERIEALETEVLMLRGAAKGVAAIGKDIQTHIVAAVDKALEDPKDTRADSIKDEEQAKLVKLWVLKAVAACENQAKATTNRAIHAQGKVDALNDEHKYLLGEVRRSEAAEARRKADEEAAKNLEGHPDIIKDEDGDLVYVGTGTCPPGVRPGNRKQKEAHAAAQAAKPVGELFDATRDLPPVAVLDQDQGEPKPPPTPVVKRFKRPAKKAKQRVTKKASKAKANADAG